MSTAVGQRILSYADAVKLLPTITDPVAKQELADAIASSTDKETVRVQPTWLQSAKPGAVEAIQASHKGQSIFLDWLPPGSTSGAPPPVAGAPAAGARLPDAAKSPIDFFRALADSGQTLKLNDRGVNVAALQTALNQLHAVDPPIKVDGQYLPPTQKAVKAFAASVAPNAADDGSSVSPDVARALATQLERLTPPALAQPPQQPPPPAQPVQVRPAPSPAMPQPPVPPPPSGPVPPLSPPSAPGSNTWNPQFPSPSTLTGEQIGALARKYESTGNPASIGFDGPGGDSYGLYQLATNAGSPQAFMKWLAQQPKYADLAGRFSGMEPGTQQFNTTWKAVAAQDAQRFGDAQTAYTAGPGYYRPVVQTVLKATGIDLSQAPLPVQQAVFSTAIQHGIGGAPKVIEAALAMQKGKPGLTPDWNGIDTGRLLNDIYLQRGLTSPQGGVLEHFERQNPSIQQSAAHRFSRERLDLLTEYLPPEKLSGMTVDQAMTPADQVTSFRTTDTFAAAQKKLVQTSSGKTEFTSDTDFQHADFPVLDPNGKLVGVVSNRTLLGHAATNESIFQPNRAKPVAIQEGATLEQAAEMMKTHGVGHLPVLKKDGTLAGFISSSTLLKARGAPAAAPSSSPPPAPAVGAAKAEPVLDVGSSGPNVTRLQTSLKRAGFDLDVDGKFGPHTHDQVKAYKESRGLTADGVVDADTWHALETSAPPVPRFSPAQVASLASQYETTGDAGVARADASNAGATPSGRYGLYALDAQKGAPAFVTWLKTNNPALADKLKDAPGSPAFDTAWQALATDSSTQDAFKTAQSAFFRSQYYDAAVAAIQQRTGVSLGDAPLPVQQTVFDAVVGRGVNGAADIFKAALDRQKGRPDAILDWKSNGHGIDSGFLINDIITQRALSPLDPKAERFTNASSDVTQAAHRLSRERVLAIEAYLGPDTLKQMSAGQAAAQQHVTTFRDNQTIGQIREQMGVTDPSTGKLLDFSKIPGFQHSGFPIVDGNEKVVGFISNRALLDPSNKDDQPVSALEHHDLVTVGEGQSLLDAAKLMDSGQVGHLPVVDKDGKLVGVLTPVDLLKARDPSKMTRPPAPAGAKPIPTGEPLPPTATDVGLRRIQIGIGELGINEGPARANAGPALKYAHYFGRGPEPWCADFQSWVSEHEGHYLGKKGVGIPYCPTVEAYLRSNGRWKNKNDPHNPPKPGDYVLFDWNGDGTPDHIGMVEKVLPNGDIQTIEGNSPIGLGEPDGVARHIRHLGTIRGFGSPS
jgi:CBS domain-containing protein